jgi:hypothetical protein
MEPGRYTLPQEGATPAQHIEPRRSCPAHRLGSDSLSSHCLDGALWHRGTARRVGPLATPRYRQPTHAHPHSRRERLSGPRCHAQSHPAGSFTRLLARAEAQTEELVIPGRALAPPIIPSPPRPCGMPAKRRRRMPVCRIESIPTRFATALLHTCWKTGLTCAPFSCSWDIMI